MERATGFETVNAVSRSFAKIRIKNSFSLGFKRFLISQIELKCCLFREPKRQKTVTNCH